MMVKMMAALLAAAALTVPAGAQVDRPAGGFRAAPEVTEAPSAMEVGQAERQAPQERRAWRQDERQDRRAWRQDQRQDRRDWRQDQRQDRRDWRQDQRQDRGEWRQDRRDDRGEWRQDRREDRLDRWRDRAEDRQDWQRDRRDWQRDRWDDRGRFDDGRRWRDGRDGGWSRDWRRDRRYDWQDWRFRNGDRFRLGRYRAPPGWGFGYRRLAPGFLLPPPVFGRPYWLNDPWAFHLPPVGRGLRWIRYWDDVVLVDLRSGRVLDVIPGFFW